MKVGKQKPPVVAIEKLGLELGPIEGDAVEELARYGARLILSSYVHAEVEAHLGAGWYEHAAERQGRGAPIVDADEIDGQRQGFDLF